MADNEADGKITITITGNSLHFHRDTNFWFETTFVLPAGTDPQQLHATIKRSSPPEDSIGEVVFAIFKVEDGTLTLAGEQASAVEPPKAFPSAPGGGRVFATTSRRFNLKRRIRCPNPNELDTPDPCATANPAMPLSLQTKRQAAWIRIPREVRARRSKMHLELEQQRGLRGA